MTYPDEAYASRWADLALCGSRVRMATRDDLRAVGLRITTRTTGDGWGDGPSRGDDWHEAIDADAPLRAWNRTGPLARPLEPDPGTGLTEREVAALAGVSRSGLRLWRRRYPDFPSPRYCGVRLGHPLALFDPDEITHWLTERQDTDD